MVRGWYLQMVKIIFLSCVCVCMCVGGRRLGGLKIPHSVSVDTLILSGGNSNVSCVNETNQLGGHTVKH